MKFSTLFHPGRPSIAQGLIITLTSAVTLVTLIAVGWIYVEATIRMTKQLNSKADNAVTYLKSVLTIPLWNYDSDVVRTIGRTLME